MKVLELYSGIGGMHLALKGSGVKGEVIASVDINTTANEVYKHNFPNTFLINRNIESLTSNFINELGVDTILMSPPCQPFTRNGLKRDIRDVRTHSFVHVLEMLPDLNVNLVLLENVKGFELSEMRNNLIETLKKSDFAYQEFILSPSQLGIPNTRHRYYCLAKRKPEHFFFVTNSLMEYLPQFKLNITYPISKVIEPDVHLEQTLVPDKILLKYAAVFDICNPSSMRSCCFTKAYGRYLDGTGSVYTNKTEADVDKVYEELKNFKPGKAEYLYCIKSLDLRFFSPREVCRLMCFPESFSFPQSISNKQKYMLLGNSINIKVVSELVKFLVS